jgi:hypothetical protein
MFHRKVYNIIILMKNKNIELLFEFFYILENVMNETTCF